MNFSEFICEDCSRKRLVDHSKLSKDMEWMYLKETRHPELVSDPDDLTLHKDIYYDTINKIIYIKSGHAIKHNAGILGGALFSFTLETWINPKYKQHDFPFSKWPEPTNNYTKLLSLNYGWSIDPEGLILIRESEIESLSKVYDSREHHKLTDLRSK